MRETIMLMDGAEGRHTTCLHPTCAMIHDLNQLKEKLRLAASRDRLQRWTVRIHDVGFALYLAKARDDIKGLFWKISYERARILPISRTNSACHEAAADLQP